MSATSIKKVSFRSCDRIKMAQITIVPIILMDMMRSVMRGPLIARTSIAPMSTMSAMSAPLYKI